MGARFCDSCGSALLSPTSPRRKLATLLFCDVSGSTAMGDRMDAEAVREVMFRYFHEMRSAIEGHGGTIEKFVGDAVMAVFGVPVAREDDALRAVRAAAEMNERLASLNQGLEVSFGTRLALRIGLNTGEVVAGDTSSRETFVTGDAVNVAARLEEAASAGDILLGEETYALVRHSVRAEAVPPVDAKGKDEPVPAYRLVSVEPSLVVRRVERPLVGRDRELSAGESLFERAVTERRSVLVTVTGEPGVGKSRLAKALCDRLASRASVFAGRCLAYGEGITFWPLAEIVREAASIRDEHSPEEARNRIASLVEPKAADQIAALAGLEGEAPEAAWAVRKLVEALASERPLILLFEDLHWAEPTLLDLLADVALRTQAPVLVLCTARPELAERRPDWPDPLRLEPLPDEAIAALLAEWELDDSARRRVVDTARGNPLFAEELAALLAERPEADTIPATLTALISARLDLLSEQERATAERGSVEGEVFHRGAVEALCDDPAPAREALESLVARGLVYPTAASFEDEAAFRFKHVLIRDAAYIGLGKRLRAELHRRFADWLEAKAGERLSEVEEIVGYHLEQAFRYHTELGPPDDDARRVAARAGERLAAAGMRAEQREDWPAAVNMLERGRRLLSLDSPGRAVSLRSLARAFHNLGDLERAEATYAEVIEAAHALDMRATEWRARLMRAVVRRDLGLPGSIGEMRIEAERARAVFEGLVDEEMLARAWLILADAVAYAGEGTAGLAAAERSFEHARRADDPRLAAAAAGRIAEALGVAPVPAGEALTRTETLLDAARASPYNMVIILCQRAAFQAMIGDFDQARGTLAEAVSLCEEFALKLPIGYVHLVGGGTETLAEDFEAADRALRTACEMTEAYWKGGLAWSLTALARLAVERGRPVEALDHTARAAILAPADDVPLQVAWRGARGAALAHTGDHQRAEELTREALQLAARTDSLDASAQVHHDLGEVLRLAGRSDEAARAFEQALSLYERRGNLVVAARVRALLAELMPRPAI